MVGIITLEDVIEELINVCSRLAFLHEFGAEVVQQRHRHYYNKCHMDLGALFCSRRLWTRRMSTSTWSHACT